MTSSHKMTCRCPILNMLTMLMMKQTMSLNFRFFWMPVTCPHLCVITACFMLQMKCAQTPMMFLPILHPPLNLQTKLALFHRKKKLLQILPLNMFLETRIAMQEMKELGDAYVKNEFRLHSKVTNEQQLQNFFQEWTKYSQQLEITARAQQLSQGGMLDDTINTTSSSSSAITSSHEDAGSSSPVFTFGQDLPQDMELSDEQTEQLEKLRKEASEAGKGA
mmetsp:Transcript_26824/g.37723  ORF Transcript_26824/g.37723 Transcript_26824/m.37723 type:complete len:220 (-) Transcript_26824:787-1446(-)